jgi:3-methylfumaryl-CoA hydratase
VHGPLQANLLLNQAAQLLGRVPRLFSYRCVAPLIAGGQFDVLTAHSPGGAAKGTIVDVGGVITTECKAEFSVMP